MEAADRNYLEGTEGPPAMRGSSLAINPDSAAPDGSHLVLPSSIVASDSPPSTTDVLPEELPGSGRSSGLEKDVEGAGLVASDIGTTKAPDLQERQEKSQLQSPSSIVEAQPVAAVSDSSGVSMDPRQHAGVQTAEPEIPQVVAPPTPAEDTLRKALPAEVPPAQKTSCRAELQALNLCGKVSRQQ
jgi:hypothetical protein